jgi:hypothetical protein
MSGREPAQQKTRAVERLFDHLVGAGEKCRGNIEAESLRRLEVHHHLEVDRLLNRQVGGLFSAQDAINVGGCLPVLVGQLDSVDTRPPSATKCRNA